MGRSAVLLKGHALRLGIDASHFGEDDVAPERDDLQPSIEYLGRAGGMLAAAWFKLCGYSISWPLEPCRFDLIVSNSKGEDQQRVQVKTTTRKVGGHWIASITTSGRVKTAYDPDEIDDFFIIDSDLNYYLIPITAVGGLLALQLNAYEQYKLPHVRPLGGICLAEAFGSARGLIR